MKLTQFLCLTGVPKFNFPVIYIVVIILGLLLLFLGLVILALCIKVSKLNRYSNAISPRRSL